MAEVAVQSDSDVHRVLKDISDLGLEKYTRDLDRRGYTVIPPEIASPNGLAERMLEACLDIAEQRNGVRPDLETGSTHANLGIETTATRRGKPGERKLRGRMPVMTDDVDSPVGDVMQCILVEDPVFEESLMNPVLIALSSYLCGYRMMLSGMGCWMKGPNKSPFNLHSDSPIPSPMAPQAVVCQCTYALTDYNRENGGVVIVPGSHKFCRHPTPDEASMKNGGNDLGVQIEAKAGSLIIWHGNTWHGAMNRTARGLRVSVTNFMVRPFIHALEDFSGNLPQEMLDRNSSRFALVTQHGVAQPRLNQEDGQMKTARANKYVSAHQKESETLARSGKNDWLN
jgi:hypothetical protein